MAKTIKTVLIGSPIHQKPEILKEFLSSLKKLDSSNISISYMFIDDNEDKKSSQMLEEFKKTLDRVTIEKSTEIDPYDEKQHHWNEKLIWKVAEFKNKIIEAAIHGKYDYLFLIDSDIVLKSPTLVHLISMKKDIVSEIFWTRWEPDLPPLPQVWLSDQYTLHPIFRGAEQTIQEQAIQQLLFLKKLRTPGVYEVGGLGACTLISKDALAKGVNFNEIKNVSFVGEDRHFCIRAAALGIPLYVDTHYPAFHIYRISDLDKLKSEE